jgi:hypothetical protein
VISDYRLTQQIGVWEIHQIAMNTIGEHQLRIAVCQDHMTPVVENNVLVFWRIHRIVMYTIGEHQLKIAVRDHLIAVTGNHLTAVDGGVVAWTAMVAPISRIK